MTQVRDVMAKEPKTAGPDMDATNAAGLMASYDIGVVPIVEEDGSLLGLVTDRDLVLRVLADRRDPTSVPLGEIATRKSLFTISPDATVAEAQKMMASNRVKRLIVTDDDVFVSVVSLGDIAQSGESMQEVGETVREITESPATTEGP
ncbi:MAG: CBS domain-containing protein [Actinomycetota bacterium]